MTQFEYLAVLFSVVVGLAVAQTLRGLLHLVRHRATITLHWPTLLWTAGLIQWTIYFWWFTFSLTRIDEWRLSELLFVLLYASALYFLLGLLHPDDAGSTFDMPVHFNANRGWFFGVFLGLGLMDVADTWLKTTGEVGAGAPPGGMLGYAGYMGVWLLGSLVVLKFKSERLLTAFALAYLIITIGVTVAADGLGSI